MTLLDNLPVLSGKEAYEAMLEFLRAELELAGGNGMVHLGGLLSELELMENGDSADPGGTLQFLDAVNLVTKRRENSID